jgi:arsenate reductase
MVLYWVPTCSTCSKAVAFLQQNGLRIEKRVDLQTARLDQSRLKELARKAGSVELLFSRRSFQFRNMKLHGQKLSDKDLVDLMACEYSLIKRPIVELSARAIVGWNFRAYAKLVGLS